jgi:hypothetical protein
VMIFITRLFFRLDTGIDENISFCFNRRNTSRQIILQDCLLARRNVMDHHLY